MQRRLRPVALGACVAAIGCITEFKHPLGSVSQSFIEPVLLGSWTCRATADPSLAVLTFMNFDGKQYYLRSEEQKSDPQSYRATATRLEDSSFLSLQRIGSDPDDAGSGWTILEYSLRESGDLTLRLVDPAAFEGALDDPQAIRDLLAARLEDPEAFSDSLSCTR